MKMEDKNFLQNIKTAISSVTLLKYSVLFVLFSFFVHEQLFLKNSEINNKILLSLVLLETILFVLLSIDFYFVNRKFNEAFHLRRYTHRQTSIVKLFKGNKALTKILFNNVDKKDISNNKHSAIPLYPLAKGGLKNIEEVDDEIYSNKTLGDGFAIVPSEGKVRSPIDGKIVSLFPTKHAVGIKDKNGIEYLIHMGIDTIDLNGHGFQTFVELNQKVETGDLLTEMDLDYIASRHKTTDIIFVALSKEQIDSLDIVHDKKVGLNETIGEIILK